jgi:hypothetical protein
VEHVRPKSVHADLRLDWDNFLLACPHCNSIKAAEDVDIDDYSWPDTDNPLLLLAYGPEAMVHAKPGLEDSSHQRAVRTIELVGLDRIPGAASPPSPRDRRWRYRQEAWRKARQARIRLRQADTPQLRETIIELAVSDGYWSVWYAAFAGDENLRRRLIEATRQLGTCVRCFDDHGEPVTRPGAGR